MYKMFNLSLKELRLISKNRNINGYESMAKDKLLKIINNNKGGRKSLLISEKEETKKIFKSRDNLFKLKRKKILINQ